MTLKEIESKIAELAPSEFAEFRRWFFEFDGDLWDEQISKDATAGKLDTLADNALVQFRTQKTQPL